MRDIRTKRLRVLLVEDDTIDRLAFERHVRTMGLDYDYMAATSVEEARRILDAHSFDIIITDFQLGGETAMDIFPLAKGLPVIVTTGGGCEETAAGALRAGAYDYMIKDPDRNYLKLLPHTVDNAMRRKEAELRTAMLSQAMTDIGDSVYITEMDDTIIFVNRRFLQTYGYDEQEILGASAAILMPDAADVHADGSPHSRISIDFTHVKKNGDQFPVHLTHSIIRDDNDVKVAIVGVVRDLSEQRRMEDKRLQAERLKTAIEMAGAACHELNQPLQAIAGYTDLMLLDTEPETELGDALTQIKAQVDRMAGITRKLNSITRYETTPYLEGMRIIDINKASSR